MMTLKNQGCCDTMDAQMASYPLQGASVHLLSNVLLKRSFY
jgi:hypothetical protein